MTARELPFLTAGALGDLLRRREVSAVEVTDNPFNITGHPALSVPCGFSGARLPAGLQVIGRHHREEDILRVAGAYQAVTAWHAQRPTIPGEGDHE